MDHLSKEKRSWNMSRVKSKNTGPEYVVRKYLYNKGYRYRLHNKNLPGNPDISNVKRKIVIFVNGCFWHMHENCKYASIPKSNREFWIRKLNKNVERDALNYKKLEDLGYRQLIIWECEIKDKSYKEKIDQFFLNL